ncbi:PanM family protein, partial [Pseudomonas aeruginosa]|nr:PanM family protein [Pseudomonas aeruginosa]
MPVIVETLAQPSAQDRLDLAKIYADATPNGFLADAGLDAVLAVLPAPS